ncbi:MAG: ATP-binding protein [Bacteroidales bacterium]|nr:ATP-binding protein [Bacteroidales bacterium]
MKRYIDQELLRWKSDPVRKTLLVRGARQVGKTFSVRELGKSFTYYLEVNFESDREVHHFFEKDLDPNELSRNLSAYYNVPIKDGETLLFFDEIQACIPAISSLRFFHEKKPGLHLVAAGSLLEFALKDIPSFGVGRIEHLFMYPLSFDEFLIASGQEQQYHLKRNSSADNPLNDAFHFKLISYLKQYLLLGGLPEVIQSFLDSGDYFRPQAILDQLITGLEDDFAKYKARVPSTRLTEVFKSVVFQAGNKFNFSRASDSANHPQTKEALELLEMAGLVYRVKHTAANGLPLGAEINPKKFKVILFDHGIFHRILGLELSTHLVSDSFSVINKGQLAEQYAGTEIIKYSSNKSRAPLYYWHREKRGSSAEVDYLVQKDQTILPVEVKSGTQGKMQSLRIFMNEKNIQTGIRVSLENFCQYDNIQVYPLYAIENIFS